jgi:hypothetical protein
MILCLACQEVLDLYGTLEFMSEEHCSCKYFIEEKLVSSEQKLITYLCTCPVFKLKHSGKFVIRCNC